MRGETGLMADLTALAIQYDTSEHQAVFTVEESHAIRVRLPGDHTKNLFLKDAGGDFWLLTVPCDARVDLKALPMAIGCKRVSFANADEMERLIGIMPGSVTPLAAINAAPGSVWVVIESGLARAGRINVHPLRNTATIGLAGEDLMRLLSHWGHEPIVADIPVLEV